MIIVGCCESDCVFCITNEFRCQKSGGQCLVPRMLVKDCSDYVSVKVAQEIVKKNLTKD